MAFRVRYLIPAVELVAKCIQGGQMATHSVELSTLNLQALEAFFLKDSETSEETKVPSKEQAPPDEFEIRRKLFFGA
jgi:hypothetical protein